MDITPDQLHDQVTNYLAVYPWVWDVESQFGLPRGLLLAVGSRETDLILGYADGSMVGDGGYGHGTWQEDNHPQNANPERDAICARIQSGDCAYAAQIAAGFLRYLLDAEGGSVDRAADRYNDGGYPWDSATTGHDYGEDVIGRLAWIVGWYLSGHFPNVTPTVTPVTPAVVPAVPHPSEEDDHMEYLVEVNGYPVKARKLNPRRYPAVSSGGFFIIDPIIGKRALTSQDEVRFYMDLFPADRQYVGTNAKQCVHVAATPSI